jgi:hypothetical protein
MDFTIQYFGMFDQLLYVEGVDADELIDVLERARATIKQPSFDGDLQAIGYVILDYRGRQVARGYRRDLAPSPQ